MKILVLGQGGREHVIASVLSGSQKVEKIFISPGNGGTALEFQNVALSLEPPYTALIQWIQKNQIEFVVVGPEDYLVSGVVNALEKEGIATFGPKKEAAMLEGSKTFAKEIMNAAGVPTAAYRVFTDKKKAQTYIESLSAPIVLKADGLAAGKGVIVAASRHEALQALDVYLVHSSFGEAGKTLLIESFLKGQEVSILAFTDGKSVKLLPPCQDHKRIFEDDLGPNTGGMGVYTPVKILNDRLVEKIKQTILLPTIGELKNRGILYKGILYVGLMVEGEDIQVVEFNCRFGDPEAQCVLPLLETDLLEVMRSCLEGTLAASPFKTRACAACTVILASGGYPEAYEKGHVISGLSRVCDAKVYHAGTQLVDGKIITSGGRVLAVSAEGQDLKDAISKTYREIQPISFKDAYYRKDIGQKGL